MIIVGSGDGEWRKYGIESVEAREKVWQIACNFDIMHPLSFLEKDKH